jgi:hypothetical protein
VNEGNKGTSIWDTFARQPGKNSNNLQKLIYIHKNQ